MRNDINGGVQKKKMWEFHIWGGLHFRHFFPLSKLKIKMTTFFSLLMSKRELYVECKDQVYRSGEGDEMWCSEYFSVSSKCPQHPSPCSNSKLNIIISHNISSLLLKETVKNDSNFTFINYMYRVIGCGPKVSANC